MRALPVPERALEGGANAAGHLGDNDRRVSSRAPQRLVSLVVTKVRADGCVVWMSPPDAERMACGICVHAVAFAVTGVVIFEQSRTEGDGMRVRVGWIGHMKINMHLLRGSVGPSRRDVVGRELYADPPPAVAIRHAVPAGVSHNATAEHARPERALRCKIGRIEYDDLTHQLDVLTVAAVRQFADGRT
jgi:hypothetical protein